jgi:threonine aldolase
MPPTEVRWSYSTARVARRFDARLKQGGPAAVQGPFYAAPFIGMLEDGALGRHAATPNAMAQRLAALMPFRITHPVEANGVFVEMDDARLAALHASGWFVYRFLDGSVRFCAPGPRANRPWTRSARRCARSFDGLLPDLFLQRG